MKAEDLCRHRKLGVWDRTVGIVWPRFEIVLAVLKTVFSFVLGPPFPGGLGGGSGLPFSGTIEVLGRFRPRTGGRLYIFKFHFGFQRSLVCAVLQGTV